MPRSGEAGDSLTIAEMKSLVERLFESEDPYRCPHGRPVVVLVPGGCVGKEFWAQVNRPTLKGRGGLLIGALWLMVRQKW